MTEEDHFKSVEDVELLIRWMQAPPNAKPIVPFDPVDYLERLQLALRWLHEHMSVRKVWRMMFEHFRAAGRKYSEATARRDVKAAQRLFGTQDSHDPQFWTGLMVDALSESFLSAKRAHKYGESARLAKVLKEWIILGNDLGVINPEEDQPPALLIAVATPSEAGMTESPDLMLQVEDFLRRRAAKKLIGRQRVTDVEFTEDGGQPPTT